MRLKRCLGCGMKQTSEDRPVMVLLTEDVAARLCANCAEAISHARRITDRAVKAVKADNTGKAAPLCAWCFPGEDENPSHTVCTYHKRNMLRGVKV